MFDFSWSEIMVIGIVALIAIGPKDMPVAIRAITKVLKKMRRMAGEFQHHVDEMMREADLQDVQATFRDLRGMNLKQTLNRAVDPDGSIGRAMTDPFAERPVPPAGPAWGARQERYVPPVAWPVAPAGPAPAFIPPGTAAPAPIQPAPPPAFVPPGASGEA
jgi:sec-independent protein translocase protein TatB